MKVSKSFWSLMPKNYFIFESGLNPKRPTEIESEFRIVFLDNIGRQFLKNSTNLTWYEQEILDAEISSMQFGFEGGIIIPLVGKMTGRFHDDIELSLDKITAKFLIRETIDGKSPPVIKHKNNYETYWQDYFNMV